MPREEGCIAVLSREGPNSKQSVGRVSGSAAVSIGGNESRMQVDKQLQQMVEGS